MFMSRSWSLKDGLILSTVAVVFHLHLYPVLETSEVDISICRSVLMDLPPSLSHTPTSLAHPPLTCPPEIDFSFSPSAVDAKVI